MSVQRMRKSNISILKAKYIENQTNLTSMVLLQRKKSTKDLYIFNTKHLNILFRN